MGQTEGMKKMLLCCFGVGRTRVETNEKPTAGEVEEEEEEEVSPHAGRRMVFLGAFCMKGRSTVSRSITMIRSFGRKSTKDQRPSQGKNMPTGPPQPRPREIRY